jgi:hypothetical protein
MVIFLAVEGGLSIFAAGEKEPNGYILCFACLVGAVFSEHVWQWARVQLLAKLPTGNAAEIQKRSAAERQHEGDERPETPDSNAKAGVENHPKLSGGEVEKNSEAPPATPE